MDKLWAPWRSAYVKKINRKQTGCLFCRIYAKKIDDKKNFVVCRSEYAYAVLNIYPYNNGHVLIIPNRHVDDTSKLKKNERDDLYNLLEEIKLLLKKVMKVNGFNIGINLGKDAGAGFPGHVHIHVVPRWRGDVNFMPVTADTKVISQSLTEVHKQLVDEYKKRH
ncbi:MAG: HIT domain-containing protein [Candidatus Omnitrophica bacterium]|nr:HIT domain-containing protein [Candidatus Omnitrophota bacterium]